MSERSELVPAVSDENWRRVWDFDAALRNGKNPDPADAAKGATGGEEGKVLLACLWQEVVYRLERCEPEPLTAGSFAERFPGIEPDLVERFIRQARDEFNTDSPGTAPAPEHAQRAASEPLPSIPGYEVLGVLGRGGAGVVYKARRANLKRLIALKMILSGGHTGATDLARFKTEAEAVAQLSHPNIVQIFEVGEFKDLPFFTLEFVDGGSLAAKLAGAPQVPRFAASLTQALARGIQAAHALGIVHRDLKPGNILLTQAGTPKIADFGLAKLLNDDLGHTQTGTVLGTPSYMAPEQAAGRTKDIGPAADVYGLGAILYEMLTGRPPFRGTSKHDTLEQVRKNDPVPPRKLQPKMPRDLETVCLKCLLKDPRQRYASAGDLADDLQRFLDDEPIKARAPSFFQRAIWFVKRHRFRVALTAAALLAALALLGGSAWAVLSGQYQELETAKRRTDEAFTEAKTARNDEERARKGAELARDALKNLNLRLDDSLYVNLIQRAQLACAARNYPLARSLLLECPERLRYWEWDYLWGLCEQKQRVISAHRKTVADMVLSGDGELLTAGDDGFIKLWDRTTGKEKRSFDARATGQITGVALSPDRRLLASVTGEWNGKEMTPGSLSLWDCTTGERLKAPVVVGKHPGFRVVTFLPDGKRVATAGFDKVITIRNVDTGQVVATFAKQTRPFAALVCSQDGKYLASATADWSQEDNDFLGGQVQVWDTKSGDCVCACNGPERGILALAFSPDSKQLAGAGSERDVFVWSVPSGQQMVRLTGNMSFIGCLAFSSDGRRLAAGSGRWDEVKAKFTEGQVCIWDTSTFQVSLRLRGHANFVTRVAFGPDDEQLWTGGQDGQARVWDLVFRPEQLTYRVHEGFVYSAAHSPDGTRVASAGQDRVLRVWSATTGKTLHQGEGHGDEVGGVAYRPDGKQIATTSKDGTVILWDSDARAQRRLAGHTKPVLRARFAPDGKSMATCGEDHTVKIWDTDTGLELKTLSGHKDALFALAYSPDGKYLASGGKDKAVRVWEAASGKSVQTFSGHVGQIWAVAFSPDGNRLASAGADQVVHLWDLRQGRLAGTLRGHESWVMDVAFSPDGRRLATAGGDLTARLWSPQTGLEVLTLLGHQAPLSGVSFSRDGTQLLTTSQDGTVKIWSAPRR